MLKDFLRRNALWLAVVLVSSACAPGQIVSPRLATQTAQALTSATATPPPVTYLAPTQSARSGDLPLDNENTSEVARPLTFWVNETSPGHQEVLEQITRDFTSNTGVFVDLVMIAPELMPELIQTAVLSDTLPDLILHSFEYTWGWEDQGILDSESASRVLEELGSESFNQGALGKLSSPDGSGQVAALPSDGWQQLLIYRTDWFEALSLSAPDSFENLQLAAETIFDPEANISGIIVPTDSRLTSTQRAFEHFAIANRCRLVNRDGEIELLHPNCLEALEFYRALINNYSPIGVQTDTSALNAYLAGRTGIILASPSVLPAIAGVDTEYRPVCPECSEADFLALNSGIVTRLGGSAEGATAENFDQIRALGITTAADPELASRFAEYWFRDGYETWLSVDPESKVPLYLGQANGQESHLERWMTAPIEVSGGSLGDFYDQETISLLSQGIGESSRWGFDSGYGNVVTILYSESVLSPLLQDMLSGYFSSSQTIIEMHRAVIESIPGISIPTET